MNIALDSQARLVSQTLTSYFKYLTFGQTFVDLFRYIIPLKCSREWWDVIKQTGLLEETICFFQLFLDRLTKKKRRRPLPLHMYCLKNVFSDLRVPQ